MKSVNRPDTGWKNRLWWQCQILYIFCFFFLKSRLRANNSWSAGTGYHFKRWIIQTQFSCGAGFGSDSDKNVCGYDPLLRIGVFDTVSPWDEHKRKSRSCVTLRLWLQLNYEAPWDSGLGSTTLFQTHYTEHHLRCQIVEPHHFLYCSDSGFKNSMWLRLRLRSRQIF
jgi:hypothetical protein